MPRSFILSMDVKNNLIQGSRDRETLRQLLYLREKQPELLTSSGAPVLA